LLPGLPDSHFYPGFECLFEISSLNSSASRAVLDQLSPENLPLFAAIHDPVGVSSFWKLIRNLCRSKYVHLECALALMSLIAAQWREAEEAIRIEMLWIVYRLRNFLGDSWIAILNGLELHDVISSCFVDDNKQMATAAVTCFARAIQSVRPLECHLAYFVGLLPNCEFAEIVACGILEVLRYHRDLIELFMAQGILDSAMQLVRKNSFRKKDSGIKVLCAVVNSVDSVNLEEITDYGIIELFIEYLDTAPGGGPSNLVFQILKALLALLRMADVCGKRELFVFCFSKGDGESVMESLTSLVEMDESGLALLSILEKVYRSDSV
jgi:hypothetical protein